MRAPEVAPQAVAATGAEEAGVNSMASWIAAYAVGAAYSGLPVSDVTSELRSAGFDEHVLDTAREAIRELRLVDASVRRSAMSLITHAAAS